MAVLEIKKYPDPVLKRRAKEVKKITAETYNLSWDMLETMIQKQGRGLAAPQLGVLKRVITVHTERGPEVFINPKILRKSRKTEVMEEGCLSFPELWLKIKRAKEVEIEALNEEGEKQKIRAQGIISRVFQHEIDHLNGILFIDRLTFWQKLKLRKKLKAFKSKKS